MKRGLRTSSSGRTFSRSRRRRSWGNRTCWWKGRSRSRKGSPRSRRNDYTLSVAVRLRLILTTSGERKAHLASCLHFLPPMRRMLVVVTVAGLFQACHATIRSTQAAAAAPEQLAELWVAPPRERDLYWGVGGQRLAPDPAAAYKV